MFSHHIKIPNGDGVSLVPVYKCDITGKDIQSNHSWYGNDNCHICDEGMDILLQQWVEQNSGYCGKPIILYFLEKSLKRKKLDRYISKDIRNKVLQKYENKCVQCGSTKKLEVDHIKPVSKGGTNNFDNLQILCKTCNVKKGDKYG